MEAQRCHSRNLRLLLLRQKRWTVSSRTQVAVTVLGQGYDDANLRAPRVKKKLAGGVKGCCGQSSRSSAALKAAVHVATAPASHRNERHATKKQRPWRPAKHARHSLGAFCSMRSVLDVLFYSFLPKRGQQGD